MFEIYSVKMDCKTKIIPINDLIRMIFVKKVQTTPEEMCIILKATTII
jgi:hypothetical protein